MALDIDNDSTPSLQLHSSLHASIRQAFSGHRPVLTHLNADTSWLLSIPYPLTSSKARNPAYYHILIDPWLRGSQSDVAAFFSQQWHEEESAVQTIEEIEDVIQGIEDVARGEEKSQSNQKRKNKRAKAVVDGGEEDPEAIDERNWINAVIICHEFTDHMHKDTLLELSPFVPVFAISKAASIIKSWKHFSAVINIERFDGDWRKSSVSPLPDWLGLSRVAFSGTDLLYYHSAIMVTFKNNSKREEAEAVIYTPHGISPENVAAVASASPSISTLALMHGLQDISIRAQWNMGAQLNKGAHNGLKVQRLLNAKYWIGTHDEVKKGGGLVSWFLDRKLITLQEAMARESVEYEGVCLEDVRFEELGNGISLILE